MNNVAPILIVLTLIAATLPIVASVFAALMPSSRIKEIDDYFLYARSLDLDSYLKTSVGYSLQVASIYLFFYWTITYGLYAMLVPVAWGVGYVLVGWAVKSGRLDDFLKTTTSDAYTIHGFIWKKLGSGRGSSVLWAVFLVSLATVIGLGGTMLSEIDYSTKFLLKALDIGNASMPLEITIHLSVLGFTTLYVLWGGYRAVVNTDKIQVPFAYAAFALFTIGLSILARKPDARGFSWFVVGTAVALFASFLLMRYRVWLANDRHNRAVAVFTFVPIIVVAVVSLWLPAPPSATATLPVGELLFPKASLSFGGFGFWGMLSLGFANAVWQFIDISSLQRLQSLKINVSVSAEKKILGNGIFVTGWEAAGGWVVIMLAGFLLRALGVTDAAEVPKFLWTQTFPWSLLLPIFIFAVVVFMLSTISGFISAMSYVAHYDLIPLLGLHESQTTATSPRRPLSTLKTARTTTVVTVLVIYVLYLLLRAYLGRVEPATAQGEQIGQVLYAIYAFQLSITPTVLIALFSRSITLRAWAVLVSTAIGLITALLTSTESKPLFDISKDSWDVIPPLAVLFTASISYLLVHWVTGLGGRK